MKPLKQCFAAAVGLLVSLQRGAVPAAAASVLHAISRQTSVTRASVAAGTSRLGVNPEVDRPESSQECGHCFFMGKPLPLPGG